MIMTDARQRFPLPRIPQDDFVVITRCSKQIAMRGDAGDRTLMMHGVGFVSRRLMV
jgi:hypothetical protein